MKLGVLFQLSVKDMTITVIMNDVHELHESHEKHDRHERAVETDSEVWKVSHSVPGSDDIRVARVIQKSGGCGRVGNISAGQLHP